jgi:O-methyltransferase
VLHIDSDLHSSAIYVLTRMDHLIRPGTIIIFDEFASALHEFRALDDYCRAYRRNVTPLVMTSDFAAQAAFIVG